MLNKELKNYFFMKPIINRFTIFLTNIISSLLPKKIRKDIDFRVKFINNIKHYFFMPKNHKYNKIIYYVHGGGFIFKMLPTHYKLIQEYSINTNSLIIAIEYSLLGKSKYPSQINEVISSVKELSKQYKIDTFMGDSAGCSIILDAYLTLSIYIKINNLILIYPVISPYLETTSKNEFTDTAMFNSKANKKMWKYYLNNSNYKDILTYIDKFKLDNLYLEVCEIDCLKDEGIYFYNKIKNVKNKKLVTNIGCYHGFEVCYNAKFTKDAINKRIEFINHL